MLASGPPTWRWGLLVAEVVVCPICNEPHHTPFSAEDVAQPQYARLLKPSLLGDPIALDAMWHILVPLSAAVRSATSDQERSLMVAELQNVAAAMGFLVAAADQAGRRGLYDSLFPHGPGRYELTVSAEGPVSDKRMDA